MPRLAVFDPNWTSFASARSGLKLVSSFLRQVKNTLFDAYPSKFLVELKNKRFSKFAM
jgi:hypothetical protein